MARELGYANVDAMMDAMPWEMMVEWEAFFLIDKQEQDHATKRADADAKSKEQFRAARGRG